MYKLKLETLHLNRTLSYESKLHQCKKFIIHYEEKNYFVLVVETPKRHIEPHMGLLPILRQFT